jgi:hypothetical protein
VLAALSVAVVEFAIGVPVLALASGTPWYKLHRADADIKAAFFVGKSSSPSCAAAVQARYPVARGGAAGRAQSASAVRLPPARPGRAAAWQRLAATTEELNDTDLTTVLDRAVMNAVQLFSAEEAEVFLRDGPDGPILVRGDSTGVQWSGDPGRPRRAAATCRASPRAWPGTT